MEKSAKRELTFKSDSIPFSLSNEQFVPVYTCV